MTPEIVCSFSHVKHSALHSADAVSFIILYSIPRQYILLNITHSSNLLYVCVCYFLEASREGNEVDDTLRLLLFRASAACTRSYFSPGVIFIFIHFFAAFELENVLFSACITYIRYVYGIRVPSSSTIGLFREKFSGVIQYFI